MRDRWFVSTSGHPSVVSEMVRMLGTHWSTWVFPQQRQPAGIDSRSRSRQRSCLMSIGSTRGLLYTVARILGDVQAVKKGRVGKRIGRRVVGKVTGRRIGRLFR